MLDNRINVNGVDENIQVRVVRWLIQKAYL
jgi:hypothetical protein